MRRFLRSAKAAKLLGLILALAVVPVQSQDCFVPGQCIHSELIASDLLETDVKCLEECKITEGKSSSKTKF